ncbi:MAG: hypothetical protein RLY35_623 [Bacteroidota bacterium]
MEQNKHWTREEFLKKTLWGLPMVFLGAHWLTACKKYPLPDKNFNGTVGVIGAGVAGLYAAYLLKQQGYTVQVLEASDRIGGRVHSISDIADLPIEWGASVIKGQNHLLYALMKNNGAQFLSDEIQDYAIVNGYWTSKAAMAENPDVQHLDEIISGLKTYDGADMNANLYAENQGVFNGTRHIWNARMGIQNGASTDIMGIEGIANAIQQSSNGPGDFFLKDGSLESTLLSTFNAIDVSLNTPIVAVDYTGAQVKLTDTSGATHLFDKIIVTVPVSILKDSIDFSPALPSNVQSSINALGMRPGMEVLLTFTEPFWNADAARLQMPGLCPQFEVPGTGGRSGSNQYLKAQLHGTSYTEAQALGSESAIQQALLDQLDNYFPDVLPSSKFAAMHVYDWGAQPYIQGVASFAPVGAANSRLGFSESVQSKIYWAGEATHAQGHHGTLHGAMETAAIAVEKIMKEEKA